MVAPLAGAWIEIPTELRSRPIRVVAPLAGAWIEIYSISIRDTPFMVAPLAGAWIEIAILFPCPNRSQSLPSRERGLKYASLQ